MEQIEMLRSLVWGPWLLFLFLGTGIFFTIRLRCFQIVKWRFWWQATAGTLTGTKDRAGGVSHQNARVRSQFATACTALAATVGTGNIAGVATALAAGGAGAIFWMWVSAVLGMATAYAEVYLGIRYRKKGADGQYLCGPFLYLEHGLGKPMLATAAALFCLLTSLGMGSMVQANSIADSFQFAFSLPSFWTAAAVSLAAIAVLFGGIRRISTAAARLVPCSAALYLFFCGIILFAFWNRIPAVICAIFRDAFSLQSAAGGAAGYGMMRAVSCGVSKGVFSNEAGLGSLAILHGCAGEDTSPQEQGMWGIFEVCFDTVISCTITALVILCVAGTGDQLILAGARLEGSALVAACFASCFGTPGGWIVALCMALFAFSTIIAWFYLGCQALSYLCRSLPHPGLPLLFFRILYLSSVFLGCILKVELVWNLSDIFNGLMAVPNLIGLILLSGQVTPPERTTPAIKMRNKKPLQQ